MEIKNFEELMKYLEDFENDPEKIDDIVRNIIPYIRLCDKTNIITFIDRVSSSNKIMKRLSYSLGTIYERFGIEPVLKVTKDFDFAQRYGAIYFNCDRYNPTRYQLDRFLKELLQFGEKDYIENNMKGIIASENMKILLEKGIVKKLNQINPEKFKEILPNIVAQMANIPMEVINKDLLDSLVEIVKQVIKEEKTDISELEYVDKGSTSVVYKLGNKVIKLGIPRNTDKIPYHRRILQPLIRRNLEYGERNQVYIEVAEYIDLNSNITDEDVYQIYKELRDDGIIWLDCKKANVGRLIKDNSIHFNEPIYSKNETVGYISDTLKHDSPMPKGELVILDTDLLVKEEDFKNLKLPYTIDARFFADCEQRYQKEKENDKKQKEER